MTKENILNAIKKATTNKHLLNIWWDNTVVFIGYPELVAEIYKRANEIEAARALTLAEGWEGGVTYKY